jgi:hypothetical protein
MCADELDHYSLETVGHVNDQAVLVAADVEHDPAWRRGWEAFVLEDRVEAYVG